MFWAPLGDLGATYDDHLRLLGKRVVDFLLVSIELFSLDRTAEALRAIIGSKSEISLQRGPVDRKFQVEGVALTNRSSSRKTRLNDLSHGIKIWTGFSFVLSQCTRLTDGRTELSSLDRVCISCSAVKIVLHMIGIDTLHKLIRNTRKCYESIITGVSRSTFSVYRYNDSSFPYSRDSRYWQQVRWEYISGNGAAKLFCSFLNSNN